jgi:hypothetical protein
MSELPRCERRRLGLQETDWNLLVGTTRTRSRGGGEGRPNLERTSFGHVETVDLVDDSTKAGSDGDLDISDEEEVETTVVKSKKPPHTRVILEVSHLERAFRNFPCPECKEPLELKLRTVCIATNIELICNNKECSYTCDLERPGSTTIHVDDNFSGSYERMSDYAVNVLYVLGFISVGDGSTEAGRLLGLLGLPNDTTMMNRSFGIIEQRIGKFVRDLCDEIIASNVDEEARLSMNEFDYNVWKMWAANADGTLSAMPVERLPHIDASYDMAWQQRSSGHQYNSQSGHGSLFGRCTRKLIGLVIKSKLCSFCASFKKKNPEAKDNEVPYHVCWKNHEGSSGSMESSGAVQVLVDAFEKRRVVIKRLCCDDDSSIHADCQWSNADYLKNNNTDILPKVPIGKGKNKGKLQDRPDKGKLPSHVPEPMFVADPNHRRKGLSGDLIKLDMSKVDDRFTMTRMDTTRLAKNFGYMARTLKDKNPEEYCQSANACLEHHFDNHEFCGLWCKRKLESDVQKKSSVKYYRCKQKDAKLYGVLKEKMSRFCSHERLSEMAHTLDTNMNEAFNNICTWFAPKNKVFAGTGSLHNRIAFAVGINSLGVEAFFMRLFKALGIPLSPNILYYLQLKEKNRAKRLTKVKTAEAKKNKNKRKYDNMARDVKIAKMELHKRQGTYRRGMNLDDPDDESNIPPAAAKKKKTGSSKNYCEYCGVKGHVTTRSAKCTAKDSVVKRFRKEDGALLSADLPPLPPSTEDETGELLTAETLLAQRDCELMDSLPFDAEYESDADDLAAALLEDCGSDDDDGCFERRTGVL